MGGGEGGEEKKETEPIANRFTLDAAVATDGFQFVFFCLLVVFLRVLHFSAARGNAHLT